MIPHIAAPVIGRSVRKRSRNRNGDNGLKNEQSQRRDYRVASATLSDAILEFWLTHRSVLSQRRDYRVASATAKSRNSQLPSAGRDRRNGEITGSRVPPGAECSPR